MTYLGFKFPQASPEALGCARQYLRGAITRATNEAINSAGGVLAASAIYDAVIARRNRAGVFRRNAQVIPMASDVQTVPRRISDMIASFTVEGAALPVSDFGYDGIGLVAKKLGGIHLRSSELAEDSIDAEAEDLISGIGYALALAEDQAAFKGDGTSAYGGVRGLTTILNDGQHAASVYTAVGHTTVSAITSGDIANLIALLPDWAMQNAKFYCSAFSFGLCLSGLGASGMNTGPEGNAEKNLMFLGFPVETTAQLPGSGSQTGKPVILFGDLSLASTLGERRGLNIRVLRERYADINQIGFAAIERIDISNHDLGGASSAGGCVALVCG